MGFLNLVSSFLLLIFCIASLFGAAIGLYKAVEYIEDKTYAAKRKIEQIIIGISILHVVLLFRRISVFVIGFSLLIQYMYYSLLDIYPYVQPSNVIFIVASLFALVNHFLMLRAMILGNNHILEMIFAFILIVWTTPFCFFLSLSANDEAFPSYGKKNETWIALQMIVTLLLSIILLISYKFLKSTYKFYKSRLLNKNALNFIKDKYVLITGSTDGIGKALALELASLGCNLLITGRNSKKLLETKREIQDLGGKAEEFLFDFSKPIDFKNTFDDFEIGLLINNAGCCTSGPTDFAQDNMIESIINVNITNSLLLTQEIVKNMEKNKGGYILNIGSITGDFPMPLLTTYATSKAAIKAFTENVHFELKYKNIHIECFDTGYVCTKMSKIRKPSFFVPTAQMYARCVITTFGSGIITFGYYPHFIINFFLSLIPRNILAILTLFNQRRVQKIIERKLKNK